MEALTLSDVKHALATHLADYDCEVTRAGDGYLSLQCTHITSLEQVTVVGIKWDDFLSDAAARTFGQVLREEFAAVALSFRWLPGRMSGVATH